MTNERDDLLDEELSAWVDGELDEQAAERLRAMAASDADTAARADEFRRLDQALRATAPPVVTADLRARMRARIDEAIADEASSRVVPIAGEAPGRVVPIASAPRARRAWIAPAAVAIAAGLAVYFFVAGGSGGSDPDEAGSQLAGREPASSAPQDPSAAWSGVADEDLAIVLELDNLADYEVIAQLEVLELLVALDDEAERS